MVLCSGQWGVPPAPIRIKGRGDIETHFPQTESMMMASFLCVEREEAFY